MKHIILAISLMLFSCVINAEPSEICQRVQKNYAQTGYWWRYCGPEPGKNFIREMKKDCRQTARQIDARPGASWNSEMGWAFDYQCGALNKSGL